MEEQVRRLTDDFRWLDNGDLEIVQHVTGSFFSNRRAVMRY